MAILGVLKSVFDLVAALPTLLRFIREVQREIALIKKAKDEGERQKEATKAAEDIKQAQATENEGAQRDALSSIVDNFNRK
jgi:hypothetical protein